jgi:hypothetical protein
MPLGLLKDPSVIAAEIRNTQHAIGALAHPHRFFRPFGQGGNLDERLLNPVVVDVLTAERMSCVLWNAIPGHWKEPDAWVDRALAQCRVQAWTVESSVLSPTTIGACASAAKPARTTSLRKRRRTMHV